MQRRGAFPAPKGAVCARPFGPLRGNILTKKCFLVTPEGLWPLCRIGKPLRGLPILAALYMPKGPPLFGGALWLLCLKALGIYCYILPLWGTSLAGPQRVIKSPLLLVTPRRGGGILPFGLWLYGHPLGRFFVLRSSGRFFVISHSPFGHILPKDSEGFQREKWAPKGATISYPGGAGEPLR